MNDMNLSPVGMDQLSVPSVSGAIPVSGGHLGLPTSPPHSSIRNGFLSLYVPAQHTPHVGVTQVSKGAVMPWFCSGNNRIDELLTADVAGPVRFVTPPVLSCLIAVGILSYLADRPPPQYIHPSSLNMDAGAPLSVPSNPSSLDPYQPGGAVGLEPGMVALDSRQQVGGHGAGGLHQGGAHEVPLDAGLSLDPPRVSSPISPDGMGEEPARSHEGMAVDGGAGVMPLHAGGGLELPVVLEPELHPAGLSSGPVSVVLSHPIAPLEPAGMGLEPVNAAAAAAGTEVPLGPENLVLVPSVLQLEDSNSNKENLAAAFTICECRPRGGGGFSGRLAGPAARGGSSLIPPPPPSSFPRSTGEEQNLVAYPHSGKLYFCSSRDIPPDHELLYYYSRDYARQIGVPEVPDAQVCHCRKECSSYCVWERTENDKRSSTLPPGGRGVQLQTEHRFPKIVGDPAVLQRVGPPLAPAGQKNYRCSVCEKSFTQKAHLASHMIIHTGARDLKCEHCDRLFMRRQDLKQHALTHTQERQKKCPRCDKLFWRTNHLKKHLNSHE
uniref:PR domain containing 4 n=1 Tax=Lepisosteus oculatus TaxID=7918 RepID=W5NKG3_LEPOC